MSVKVVVFVFLILAGIKSADAGFVVSPCDHPINARLPFCNYNLSLAVRVKDFVSRIPYSKYDDASLTLTAGLFGNTAASIPQLFLPPYQWWSEALHGIAFSPGVTYFGNITSSTSFPQVCTTGATFNKTLFSHIGDLVGQEGRAMNNLGHANLTFWAPNVNIFRDPRWGRGQEVAGEDPLLVSDYASRFVRGLQNSSMDPTRLRISSCCKHFTAYDVENWGGQNRHIFNAIVSEYDLTNSFLPPFETCVHRDGGQASSIMCSYNAVNGIPMCANGALMNDLARAKWGFQGYIVSDCGSTYDVYANHHYAATPSQAIFDVLSAGEDLDCGNFITQYLPGARKNHNISDTVLETALINQFSVLFRLGYFDPDGLQPFKKLNANDVNTAEAQRTALTAAQDGITLLENRKERLPLLVPRTVALLGPFFNATGQLLGNYFGMPPFVISPWQGVQRYCNAGMNCTVTGFAGLSGPKDKDVTQFDQACALAAASDVTILFMGIDQTVESEGIDRTYIALPGVQDLFIYRMASCASPRGPVVVVVFSGSSIDYRTMLSHTNVGAVMWAGYPGMQGGQAVADILFGFVSPSGRLPHTVYPEDYVRQVSMLDMQMTANASTGNPGRTYRYYTGIPVYKFGHGLTYSQFSLTPISPRSPSYQLRGTFISAKVSSDVLRAARDPTVLSTALSVTSLAFNVTNTGRRRAKFSSLFFVTPDPPGPLVGGTLSDFEKVELFPGETQTVNLALRVHAVSEYDPASPSRRAVRLGRYTWRIPDGPSGSLELSA